MRRTLVVLCTTGPYHVPKHARVALFPLHLDPPTRQHRELFRLLLGAPDFAETRSTACASASPTSLKTSAISCPIGGSSATLPTSTAPSEAAKQVHSTPPALHAAAGHTASVTNRFGCGTQTTGGEATATPSSSSTTPVGDGTAKAASLGTPPHAPTVTKAASTLDELRDLSSPTAAAAADVDDEEGSSPFWYMEAFAKSLREDSQLTPFDDIILIPNTRHPVSLRQSTHLAALAMLATRGLAHVHVDFTALEHPDESMPIVYDLICHYPNSVLVHWLHDAYEILNWGRVADFKGTVPMLLLQTQSYPPKALERQRPMGSVSRLVSRQYHAPEGHCIGGPEEEDYYRRVQRFMAAAAQYRQRQSLASRSSARERAALDNSWEDRHTNAPSAPREVDFFEDLPGVALGLRKGCPNRRGAVQSSAPREADLKTRAAHSTSSLSRGLPMPPTPPPLCSATDSGGGNPYGRSTADGRASREGHATSSTTNGPGLGFTDCARGRWWNTPGGRGDDEVEVSKSYWNSTSSSWLGSGTGTASTLPDWMYNEGITADGPRGKRPHVGVAPRGTETSEFGAAGDDSVGVACCEGGGPLVDLSSSRGRESERPSDSLEADTVVSDDGFALAVPTPNVRVAVNGVTGIEGGVYDTSSPGTPADALRDAAAPPLTSPTDTVLSDWKDDSLAASRPLGGRTSPEVRESADEDTRKRLLTREIEEVRVELERMLPPASGSATAMPRGSTASDTTHRIGAAPNKLGAFTSDVLGHAATAVSSSSLPVATLTGTASRHPSHSSARLFGAVGATAADPFPTRRRHRTVRQLIDELYPPRLYATGNPAGVAVGAAAPPHPAVSTVADVHIGDKGGAAASASSRSPAARGTTNTLTSPTEVHSSGELPVDSNPHHLSSIHNGGVGGGGAYGNGNRSSPWLDAPMVEVHPITRSTGADVRQALWEQEIQPSFILTDCVQRYVEGHGLYLDPRKETAASLYGRAGAGADYRPNSANSSAIRPGSPGGLPSAGLAGSVTGSMGVNGSVSDVSFHNTASPMTVGGAAAAGSQGDGSGFCRIVAPRDTATLSFPGLIPRLELHYDRNNLLAREQFEKLRLFQCQDGEEPDLIIPIGGDGYMMHCIRKNWRRFIPFYGVNAGHVGYLLNDRSTLEELFSSPLKLHFTTMLYCQAEKESDMGERVLLSELAFNDAWVERSSGQTALIRILVNGQERIRRLRGDGVLVSTAAGSTAYSQALGASPVPVGAPLIQVVGSNVVSPAQWRPAHLDQEDQVEFEVIDSTKRPCRCYVDSVDLGNVTRLLVRSSRVAGVTLAFSKSCDLQQKLYQMQFPKTL